MGSIDGKKIQWERSKESLTGNTKYSKATDLISISKSSDKNLSETINLPLISYYGTMRLWQDPKASKTNPLKLSQNKPSRTDGYKHCVDPRIGLKELVSWFSRQEWQSFQMGKA
ncbi:hypothetical protein HZS38_15180 [Xenorhabdus nematophila]|uniref:hypothetical protein n=1 Tax=Xenorhabdus nematophila TaxID=628 RepID=UPI000542A296